MSHCPSGPVLIAIDDLHSSPANPRHYLRKEVVEGIVAQLRRDGTFPRIYALIVRPRPEGGYEILAGHHRYEAVRLANAKDTDIREVPAWVLSGVDDREAAYLRLLSNLQSGFSDLELGSFLLDEPEVRGRHHGGRGRQGGLRQCARKLGLPESRLRRCRDAALVYRYADECGLPARWSMEVASGDLALMLADKAFQLAEIARVEPRQLWPYLVDACLDQRWTVARARHAVRAVRAHFVPLLRQHPEPPGDPPGWYGAGMAIVAYLGEGGIGLHLALTIVSSWAGLPDPAQPGETAATAGSTPAAHRLIVGDCLAVLKSATTSASPLPPSSVDLVVTSPPWYNTRHIPPAQRFADFAAYSGFLARLAEGLCAVLREGRLCCLHLADTCDRDHEFRRQPLVAEATRRFLEGGFEYVDQIVVTRHYPSASPSPARNRSRRPSAPLYALHDVILIFRRPGPEPFESLDPDLDRRWLTTVWPDLPVARRKPGDDTPRFRPEIPHRLIRMYSRPGDTVLDPFAGTGTSLVEAAALDRTAIGIECREDAVALIQGALPGVQTLRFGESLLSPESPS
ncbi:MAG: ParB N-terminal domain-containing protein [Lentisphaerae bacterium]|nr:ParB N-terminal domain-containing protein [Lentisphaerota bacterium]